MKKTIVLFGLLAACANNGNSEFGQPYNPLGPQNEKGLQGSSGNALGNQQSKNYYTNTKEYINDLLANPDYYSINEHNEIWVSQGGYKKYEFVHRQLASSYDRYDTVHYTINEKEMSLGNYGVWKAEHIDDFGNITAFISIPQGYIHNRNADLANVYTPANGIVFNGGTMAYLYLNTTTANPDATFIKGNAQFTYSPTTPQLTLEFDNYYKFSFSGLPNGNYDIQISGTNSTGKSGFNLSPSTITDKTPNVLSYGYLSKNSIEEAFGIYRQYFSSGANNGGASQGFSMSGAFGGKR